MRHSLRRALDLDLDAKTHALTGSEWKLDPLADICGRAVRAHEP